VTAQPREPHVLMMEGISPGIGKSTLAESLAESLQAEGTTVDLFPEEQLFTRADFSVVAEGFRTKAPPPRRHFSTPMARRSVAVWPTRLG
jgi:DNA polymerase III delta prime subunit